VLSLVTSGCATAGRGWTTADTAAQATFAAALAIDWAQSQSITMHCAEENPVIGPCGDRVPLGVYIPAVLVAELAAAVVLPPRYRRMVEGVAVGAELHVVWMNNALGWR